LHPRSGRIFVSFGMTFKRKHRFLFVPSLFTLLVCMLTTSLGFSLRQAELRWIGRKLWQNEADGRVEGLLEWNAGEDFLSLGIGHFIWYPEGRRGPFEESFPELLSFLVERGTTLPDWLHVGDPCPWQSRSQWLHERNSPKAQELRRFLVQTVDEQAAFAIHRLEGSLPKMLRQVGPQERERIQQNFAALCRSPKGLYALVDYVNFKGDGTLPTERYQGEGWGLLQVLERMRGEPSLESFARAAEEVLRRRVQNAPVERHEERWLPGWLHRVRGYAD
jgi:hypothetical protein